MKYYFVGIKGSGMAGLALIIKGLGHEVSGCDINKDLFTQRFLLENNIEIQDLENMDYSNSDIIVLGNAYLDKYTFNDKKVLTYQELLSTIVDKYYSIAVCGTHGKTTTTNMIKQVLSDFYLTSYLIGDGQGYAHPLTEYFVFEACEHKDHFLSYHPDIVVCLNVDYDHPDYFNSVEQVYSSFEKLTKQSKNVIIKNDNGLKIKNNFITYGLSEADYQYKIIEENADGFIVEIKGLTTDRITLPFCGYHMIDNFISSYIVLKKLGYTSDFIKSKIKNIILPKRRMEEEIFKKQIIVKDYAHHPTEIKALYDALRQKYPKKEMVVFFQPHTYTRTLSLKNAFLNALDCFDKVYVFPTFSSAREKIDLDLQAQVNEVFRKYHNVEDFSEIGVDKTSKIYIFLGAGALYKHVETFKGKFLKIN